MKRLIVLAALCLTFASCVRISTYSQVVTGNRKYASGDYQGANIAYIDASKSAEYEDWISYNVGAVYYALGEADAAEREWLIASQTQSEELLHKVFYNLGVLYYDRGQYGKAYEKFRNALEVDPTGLEAKVNLELTLAKLDIHEGGTSVVTDTPVESEASGEVNRILNYLRRMEGDVWESTQELDVELLPRDL